MLASSRLYAKKFSFDKKSKYKQDYKMKTIPNKTIHFVSQNFQNDFIQNCFHFIFHKVICGKWFLIK